MKIYIFYLQRFRQYNFLEIKRNTIVWEQTQYRHLNKIEIKTFLMKVYLELNPENFMNFLLKLGRNFRQEVRPDSVEEEIVFAGLVDLVHLLVQVVVHPRDGVDLRRQLVHLLIDAWKQVLKQVLVWRRLKTGWKGWN